MRMVAASYPIQLDYVLLPLSPVSRVHHPIKKPPIFRLLVPGIGNSF